MPHEDSAQKDHAAASSSACAQPPRCSAARGTLASTLLVSDSIDSRRARCITSRLMHCFHAHSKAQRMVCGITDQTHRGPSLRPTLHRHSRICGPPSGRRTPGRTACRRWGRTGPCLPAEVCRSCHPDTVTGWMAHVGTCCVQNAWENSGLQLLVEQGVLAGSMPLQQTSERPILQPALKFEGRHGRLGQLSTHPHKGQSSGARSGGRAAGGSAAAAGRVLFCMQWLLTMQPSPAT